MIEITKEYKLFTNAKKIGRFFHVLFIGLIYFLMSQNVGAAHYNPLDTSDVQHSLTVVLKGLNCNKGQVILAIYDKHSKFPGKHPIASKTVSCEALGHGEVQLHLPSKEIAVAVYHDLNGNEKLDVNWLQYPSEPFGFSNNARSMTGPPSFSSAAFLLDRDLKIHIELQ